MDVCQDQHSCSLFGGWSTTTFIQPLSWVPFTVRTRSVQKEKKRKSTREHYVPHSRFRLISNLFLRCYLRTISHSPMTHSLPVPPEALLYVSHRSFTIVCIHQKRKQLSFRLMTDQYQSSARQRSFLSAVKLFSSTSSIWCKNWMIPLSG